jgi:hypothetical protein
MEKLGRAGNKQNRDRKTAEWNLRYGEGNWSVMYVYDNKIMTREEALQEYYNKSYYLYLKSNKVLLDELCNSANEIYNPHAVNTGGVDLQCPAVKYALEKLGRKLIGKEKIAIGTWGVKYGKKYPDISYKLSPFKVPIWNNKGISVEQFWQEYKYLIGKESIK